MRAEIIGVEARFDVSPEQRPDGSWGPPLKVTISYRPCWKKPTVQLNLAFVYTNEERDVAVYDVVKQP